MDEVVNGVIQVMLSRSQMHKLLSQMIIANEAMFQTASKHFQQTLYKELRNKFRPWLSYNNST
jgi:hypothetical protein